MISLISPAKSQDFSSKPPFDIKSEIAFKDKTAQLVNLMKHYEPYELAKLMKISDKLAQENFDKYVHFNTKKYDRSNSKQALFAFTGDVYRGIDAGTLNRNQVKFAEDHLRILSGLYGLLTPSALIQPYRLEMGTKIQIDDETLYDFWKKTLTNHLNDLLSNHKTKAVICLASQEYSKSIDKKQIDGEWIDIDFKENKNGQFKNIGIFAKRARGLMVRYILCHKIDTVEEIKGFDIEDYSFNKELSKPNHYIFTR